MSKQAIILCEGGAGPRELFLGRILDFFGVPWQEVNARDLGEWTENSVKYAAFGSIDAVANALHQLRSKSSASWPLAVYAYASEREELCLNALRSVFNKPNLSLEKPPAESVSIHISDRKDTAGPMAGLTVTLSLGSQDFVIMDNHENGTPAFEKLISAGNASVFICSTQGQFPVFFCSSSRMIDLDQPVGRPFYDVKDHFCSVVPLVMTIRSAFSDVAWGTQELGACLIIDDPRLKARYGFCDFSRLRDLMRRHAFTTNIAFIPWNWRRTSRSASEFFKNEERSFSISIHGCDHTAGEFGATSAEVLHAGAQLARSRMKKHEARTGIRHDPIMVFPQGIFSSLCPAILKRNHFLGAVNTEIDPIDTEKRRTRIRDVWDTAIMSYGDFPIFTRRYPFHGIENFAFDLLLGKPCLIVAHHDYLKDGGADLTDLVKRITSLDRNMRWRPLGDVIRRACRRRAGAQGEVEIEMYGDEVVVGNSKSQPVQLKIRRKNFQEDPILEVLCDGEPINWTTDSGYLVFGEVVAANTERRFQVVYQQMASVDAVRRSLRFELAVATRRVLSELRDEYLSKIRYLLSRRTTKPAAGRLVS